MIDPSTGRPYGQKRRHRAVCPHDGTALVRYGSNKSAAYGDETVFGPPTCPYCGRAFNEPVGAHAATAAPAVIPETKLRRGVGAERG